ncbi:MAG: hypothetical protein A3G45_00635 [Candidatus Staskawiczbacteria bacterium RIFCSPLOWO2_12_FULL_37_15]|uniref:UDP-N-acetylglucosamine--N-acetylmuramyl-(pentapeptide) pyrophosphoryl-undecaprenol N-acetylglucosamine transferase n=1 Tax=Candidatus Staskawiczbacteria bacterium RIFCSPLOWO2_12_FULL_37_15 TaxID=1802218 RepID=A0A1G2IR58_9BACT|nr:MAG: hypothetical protein US35_C0012G0017 [Parcubacteria group bacterium GW2011_GWA2_37_10]OGZ77404.1 MAG: hypothetical protein A3G45_00635 [Candidatus Staskawiczbacteria bacterium RIFCSPLOWO2_12_FULL_37_15]
MKILFTGGGTGGHVFPIVAITREIRRIYSKKDLEFYYIGPKDEFGLILLSQEDFIIKTIVSGKIRRYFDWQNFIDILFKIPFGVLQSFFLLLKIKPDLIFSKGGSGSIAVTYCAKILKIPVFLHESDVVPGLSNQKTSKWARKVFTSFPKTEFFDPEKVTLTGNPIRKELLEGDNETAKQLFNLTSEKPVIMVFGGSQGAQSINDFVLVILNDVLKDFEIVHITGRENFKETQSESEVVIDKNLEKYYHLVGFLDEEKLKHAYRATDFIISRSGASAIFEIAALGKPSILVPLPTAAADHQAKNAYAYAETGATLVIEQDNLTPNFFMENLQSLFLRKEAIEKMKERAIEFSKPLAAKAVAREILEFLMLN